MVPAARELIEVHESQAPTVAEKLAARVDERGETVTNAIWHQLVMRCGR